MTRETQGDPGNSEDWARASGVSHPEEPVVTESRIPLITALFCGLLLHADVLAEAADGTVPTDDAANRRDGRTS